MKTFFKWLGIITGSIVLLIVAFFVGMRFHDGPLAIISGGPFTSGELTETPGDWSPISDRDTIEFQTLDPETSRTVWLAVHNGRLFLVSGYMTTGYGKIWKQWPHYIENDNRVILRIDSKLYKQQLNRITEGPLLEPVINEFGRKYGFSAGPEVVASGYMWMFEVLPRDSP